eukprot:3613360-Rhodomonas_salina.7
MRLPVFDFAVHRLRKQYALPGTDEWYGATRSPSASTRSAALSAMRRAGEFTAADHVLAYKLLYNIQPERQLTGTVAPLSARHVPHDVRL